MNAEWKSGPNFVWLYVREDGLVLGDVRQDSNGTYCSMWGEKVMSRWFALNQAMTAVERLSNEAEIVRVGSGMEVWG